MAPAAAGREGQKGHVAIKTGLALLVVGAVVLALSIFTPFARGVLIPAYWIGMVVTALSCARLIWMAWRGSLASAFAGAISTAVLTWVVYELVRQTPGVPDIGFLGEMTAPVLSATAAVVVIAVGLVRARGRSSGLDLRPAQSSIPFGA